MRKNPAILHPAFLDSCKFHIFSRLEHLPPATRLVPELLNEDVMAKRALAVFGFLLFCLSAHADPTGLGAAAPYNVFAFGNLSSSSDIAGRVAVGGNLQSNLQDGSNNEYTRFPTSAYFTVLSNGNGSYNVLENNGGSVYLGSRGSGNITIQNGTGSIVTGGTNPIDFNAAKTYLTGLSSSLALLATNGSSTLGAQGYVLVANSPITVFNISSTVFAALSNIQTNGNTVIINVSGASVASGNTAFMVDGHQPTAGTAYAAGVLFNFDDATSIVLDSSFGGTILAPSATLSGNQQVNGQLIVNNLNYSGEIHGTAFNGQLPTSPVPEPASIILVGSALAGMAPVLRRKLRRARERSQPSDQ